MAVEAHAPNDASRQGRLSETLNRATRKHLTLIPLVVAVAAIGSGEPWAWPVAASLLAVAYLGAYLEVREA